MLRNALSSAGLLALACPSTTSATLLYAASYNGTVATLNLTRCPSADSRLRSSSAAATLDVLSSTNDCAPNPSWLTLDFDNGLLYCADEGLNTPNATLSSFKADDDGNLVLLNKIETIAGSVSTVFYGNRHSGLAIAQYSGSSLTAVNISDPSALAVVQTETFFMSGAGPVPSRQDKPHPHEALTDPTGQFILVPDLGADLVRVFKYNPSTLEFSAVKPLVAPPGSGPRHAAFLATESATFMYLVSELANTVAVYKLNYDNEAASLGFEEVQTLGSLGEGVKVPAGIATAEVHISPDNRFLLLSTRFDHSFNISSFAESPKEGEEQIVSDSLVSFRINPRDATLSLSQQVPAGGRTPRQFSMNKAGDLLAVGLQDDGRVVIIERNPESGEIGDFVAAVDVDQVTCAIFDE